MKFIGSSLALIFFLALQGTAQKAKIAYPSMAPLPQYLMPRDAEISLARSAAPKSISGDAEILILTPSGYQTAVRVQTASSAWSHDPGLPILTIPIFGIQDYARPSAITLSARGLKDRPLLSGLRLY